MFARIATEKMDATATRPKATIMAVIRASIRVNPRLCDTTLGGDQGQGRTKLDWCHRVVNMSMCSSNCHHRDTESSVPLWWQLLDGQQGSVRVNRVPCGLL